MPDTLHLFTASYFFGRLKIDGRSPRSQKKKLILCTKWPTNCIISGTFTLSIILVYTRIFFFFFFITRAKRIFKVVIFRLFFCQLGLCCFWSSTFFAKENLSCTHVIIWKCTKKVFFQCLMVVEVKKSFLLLHYQVAFWRYIHSSMCFFISVM